MIEVGDVLLDDAVEMALTENEEVVQTLSAKTAEESFADGVSLWRADWRTQNLDVSPLRDPVEGCSVLAVIVADEEPWTFSERSGVAELLCNPGV